MEPETEHPTFEQLVSFTEDNLEPAVLHTIQAHLAAGCSTCQTDLDWLSQTLSLMASDQWHTPPPTLSATAQRLFRSYRPQSAPHRPILAWLQSLFQPVPRRALIWASFLLVALFSALLFWNQAPAGRAVAAVDWYGYAEMQPADAFGWQPAVGQTLRPGEWMRTSPGATADLSFFGQTAVHLGGETEVAVAALESGQPTLAVLLLQRGLIIGDVGHEPSTNLQLVISTPTTVLSSQQASFHAQVEPDGTTIVTVYEGSVQAIAQGITVTARSGQSINISLGKPPVLLGANGMAALPGRLPF
jgi:ferric-dicitrate binding protein FerR (iron transport regulator)